MEAPGFVLQGAGTLFGVSGGLHVTPRARGGRNGGQVCGPRRGPRRLPDLQSAEAVIYAAQSDDSARFLKSRRHVPRGLTSGIFLGAENFRHVEQNHERAARPGLRGSPQGQGAWVRRWVTPLPQDSARERAAPAPQPGQPDSRNLVICYL